MPFLNCIKWIYRLVLHENIPSLNAETTLFHKEIFGCLKSSYCWRISVLQKQLRIQEELYTYLQSLNIVPIQTDR